MNTVCTFVQLLLILRSISVVAECELRIRKQSVLSTWQSSSFQGPTCFGTMSESVLNTILTDKWRSYLFYHSKAKSDAINGFHWFAIHLNESVLIRSITVKGREDHAIETYNRAADIQIWTSGPSDSIFYGNPCNLRQIGDQFQKSLSKWTFCGTTGESNKKPGQHFTVNCTALRNVQHLLLRRNVVTGKGDGYMSFADLMLQTVQLDSIAPKIVAQDSNFTVSCSLHCNGAELDRDSASLQLCLPKSNCTAQNKIVIVRAKPKHSGSYKCILNSAEHSTVVFVLDSSAPSVVAQNSSFIVNCTLYCGDSEPCADSSLTSGLQTCNPQSECTEKPAMHVTNVRPDCAGVYRCRLNSTEHRAAVTVLSSAAPEFVAQNSSFAVNCSLYCKGTELCTDSTVSTNITLCYPNNTCSNEANAQIDIAQPHHSGIYKCKVKSVEHQSNVTVLYPPSNVSLSLMNVDDCKVHSEVGVVFASTESLPAAEHICSVETEKGAKIQNLSLMSFNSSRNGAVSRWSFRVGEANQTQGWNSGFIECIVVQTLPDDIRFLNEHRVRAAWSCKSRESNITLIAIISGTASTILVVTITFFILIVFRRVKQRRSHDATLNRTSHDIVLAGTPTDNLAFNSLPEGPYVTVVSKTACARDGSSAEDTESCCSEYLDIVADGP